MPADTPPPAAVPVDLALLREVAWSGALSDFDRDLVRSAAIELEHLRTALAAAERERDEARANVEMLRQSGYALEDRVLALTRERDDAAKVIADLRFNQSHLDAMRERWNELVAERDAARAELAEANAALREEIEEFCYFQEKAREAEAVLRAERDAARTEVATWQGTAREATAEADALRVEVDRLGREVERAFRAGCLAPVGALTASDEVIDRAWARYRQQRAAAGEAGA